MSPIIDLVADGDDFRNLQVMSPMINSLADDDNQRVLQVLSPSRTPTWKKSDRFHEGYRTPLRGKVKSAETH